MILPVLSASLVLLSALAPLQGPARTRTKSTSAPPTYERQRVETLYYSEGACAGDINRDGVLDVVSGPFWYEGPSYSVRRSIYPSTPYSIMTYADTFFAFCEDFDRDGWVDVLKIGMPGMLSRWYKNPGNSGGAWLDRFVWLRVDMESPCLVDIDNNGYSEIVCANAGNVGYLTYDPQQPTATWSFHPVSNTGTWTQYIHGLGVGDVSSDGRLDILTRSGWFEQPPSLAGDPLWTWHAETFGGGQGGAQMFAYDFDGDGDADVVTSINAHAYGLSWFEQYHDTQGIRRWREHEILSDLAPPPGFQGVQFSQLHAMQLADIDGDGWKDVITGKTYLAHNGTDPGAFDPVVLYAFLLRRKGGTAFFEPCLLDGDTGVGRQFSIADLDRNGALDVIVGNKKGVTVVKSYWQ